MTTTEHIDPAEIERGTRLRLADLADARARAVAEERNTQTLALRADAPVIGDEYSEMYAQLCDVVERAWQGLPVEQCEHEWQVRHTSDYARAAANRILTIMGRCEPTAI